MQLGEWQQQLQQVILAGEDNSVLLLRAGKIPRERQLGIYSNAYYLRLAEALRSNYSMLHQLLGDDDFNVMADKYIRATPSRLPSIRWFGDRLDEFLGATPPFNSVPAIAELARFEWALRHTIDAADGDMPTVEAMQAIPPEQWGSLRFDLHPSLTILDLGWNTPQIWRALTDGNEPPSPIESPCSWLVYRQPDLASYWRSARVSEVSSLRIWSGGGTFDDICMNLLNRDGEEKAEETVALQAATYLKTWVEQGLLVYPSR